MRHYETLGLAGVALLGCWLGSAIVVTLLSPRRTLKYSAKQESTIFWRNENLQRLNASNASILLREAEAESAERLSREVRVLCWVMTSPSTLLSRAWHVRATWGRHCNTLIFITEKFEVAENCSLPVVQVEARSGRRGLWAKTVHAFQHVHAHHRHQYDWVLKADDDTYVLVENLRRLLAVRSPRDPEYLGFHIKLNTPGGYMSGGAGYVLSAEAVHRLVQRAFYSSPKSCPPSWRGGAEDVYLGHCLRSVGVRAGDSRDREGRHRFFPEPPELYVHLRHEERFSWMDDYSNWPLDQLGTSCCASHPITFHYVSARLMHVLEWLVYRVQPPPVTALEPLRSQSSLELYLAKLNSMIEHYLDF